MNHSFNNTTPEEQTLQNTYRQLPSIFYKEAIPFKSPNPSMVIFNQDLAQEMNLNWTQAQLLSALSGNSLLPGSEPIAQAYAGHQFGHFTMLGDGRAILLGELETKLGLLDIQLKGAGRTQYSRGGDGKAALAPMLREYIISEALHGLGIPTTRSLAVIKTGENVRRKTYEPGAILTRIAASHLRVGTFQYADAYGSKEDLKALADYAIARDPDKESILQKVNPYLAFLEVVIKRQAELIASWQHIGMIHGVMNTDNMSISGESIDFGPVAFMDIYASGRVFSSIDSYGRYAYDKQPSIGLWNLSRLAESLLSLLEEEEEVALSLATGALEKYQTLYQNAYILGMRKKLGLVLDNPQDHSLVQDLLDLMESQKMDYTDTFLDLTFQRLSKDSYQTENFVKWLARWQTRLQEEKASEEEIMSRMKAANPGLIPRNDWVENALSAGTAGDYKPLFELVKLLKEPFAHSDNQEKYIAEHPLNQSSVYQTF